MRPADVLLVEDDPGDVLMTREALRENPVPHRLHVVTDGESALAFLRQEGDFADAPRPDLVLLDINLPRINGHEVLAEVRGDDDLHGLRVVMLTTSSTEADVARSYDLVANAHVTKPSTYDAFVNKVQAVEQFFLQVAALPLLGGVA
jgi:CheY-like chemotaxis protein